jgi:hypothetical protein
MSDRYDPFADWLANGREPVLAARHRIWSARAEDTLDQVELGESDLSLKLVRFLRRCQAALQSLGYVVKKALRLVRRRLAHGLPKLVRHAGRGGQHDLGLGRLHRASPSVSAAFDDWLPPEVQPLMTRFRAWLAASAPENFR